MANWRAGAPDGPLSAIGLAIVGAVVIVDQFTKAVAEARLPLGDAFDILPILSLYRVHNTGIAFSMFAGSGAVLMIALMVAVSAIVIVFWVRAQEGGHIAAIGFALILGGAIGNLIDRLRLGHVIDFLLLHVGGWRLFVFNIADTALTVGPALLLVVYLWPARRES